MKLVTISLKMKPFGKTKMSLCVSEWQPQEYSLQFVVESLTGTAVLGFTYHTSASLGEFKLCNGINWPEGAAIDVTIDLNYVPFLHQCNFTFHIRITKELLLL